METHTHTIRMRQRGLRVGAMRPQWHGANHVAEDRASPSEERAARGDA